jgi:hypothetical protein
MAGEARGAVMTGPLIAIAVIAFLLIDYIERDMRRSER